MEKNPEIHMMGSRDEPSSALGQGLSACATSFFIDHRVAPRLHRAESRRPGKLVVLHAAQHQIPRPNPQRAHRSFTSIPLSTDK